MIVSIREILSTKWLERNWKLKHELARFENGAHNILLSNAKLKLVCYVHLADPTLHWGRERSF